MRLMIMRSDRKLMSNVSTMPPSMGSVTEQNEKVNNCDVRKDWWRLTHGTKTVSLIQFDTLDKDLREGKRPYLAMF